eukprot:COSAG01_NODE_421_length_17271_cov_524.391218_19_plen_147_part_00
MNTHTGGDGGGQWEHLGRPREDSALPGWMGTELAPQAAAAAAAAAPGCRAGAVRDGWIACLHSQPTQQPMAGAEGWTAVQRTVWAELVAEILMTITPKQLGPLMSMPTRNPTDLERSRLSVEVLDALQLHLERVRGRMVSAGATSF